MTEQRGIFFTCPYKSTKRAEEYNITFMVDIDTPDIWIYLDHIRHFGNDFNSTKIINAISDLDKFNVSNLTFTPVTEAVDEAYHNLSYHLGWDKVKTPILYRGERVPDFKIQITHIRVHDSFEKRLWIIGKNLTDGMKHHIRSSFTECILQHESKEHLEKLIPWKKELAMKHIHRQMKEAKIGLEKLRISVSNICEMQNIPVNFPTLNEL